MKPILDTPDLLRLTEIIEQYNEILNSHAQAKVISLAERRRIIDERTFFIANFVKLSKKAIYG
jgi:hypothetical protein